MEIKDIIKQFDVTDVVSHYEPLGNGHINVTILVTTGSGNKYVLQKINTEVFKNVDILMNNFFKVTKYLVDNGFESLNLIKTKDDQLYFKDGKDCYRLYTYIDDKI